jgi:hypothetical protein
MDVDDTYYYDKVPTSRMGYVGGAVYSKGGCGEGSSVFSTFGTLWVTAEIIVGQ